MSTPVPLINCPISPHVIGASPRCIATPSKKRPREQNPVHTYFWIPLQEPNIPPRTDRPCRENRLLAASGWLPSSYGYGVFETKMPSEKMRFIAAYRVRNVSARSQYAGV